MSNSVNLATVGVSVVVNGVILFSLQQWVQHKFKRLGATVDRETKLGEKSLELLTESYRAVWGGLSSLERYLRYEMPDRINAGNHDGLGDPIREAFILFRSTLFLTDSLSGKIGTLINDLERDYNTFVAVALRQGASINAGGSGQEAVRRIQEAMSTMTRNYTTGIDGLREEFRRASHAAISGNPAALGR
ncbi:hypothetical protein [Actinacidiphila acididurans]|uniref:Uncharacterized protein n=1 Tax=Actinacidiphila acididurans TaxID=2784346 RepID=A0ABS2U3N0_9ACTN|nr:hypothetical protein [Actinacidiphila acididurans]MBM9509351.1 hypothetical protein [Actinacidiphila acididurans]